jgi:hypothetical protein
VRLRALDLADEFHITHDEHGTGPEVVLLGFRVPIGEILNSVLAVLVRKLPCQHW